MNIYKEAKEVIDSVKKSDLEFGQGDRTARENDALNNLEKSLRTLNQHSLEEIIKSCKVDCNEEYMTFCNGEVMCILRYGLISVSEWLIIGTGSLGYWCNSVKKSKCKNKDIYKISELIYSKLNNYT